MSKKILKRSLALGALMAFVITGSAMAASGVISNKIVDGKIVGTGTLNVTVSGTDQGLQLGSSTGPVSEKVIISGFDSIVLDGSNSVHKNTFNAYAGTELIIENVGSIYSADSSDLTNTTIFHAQKGNVTINNVKEISLIGVGNEFMAQGGGVLTVNANSVSVIANNGNALQCSYSQEDSSITINADNLSLVSTTAAGISSMGGDVVADVTENIYVEGSNGVNANYGGTVSLEAKNITVKNNGSRNAVRAANGGSVSVNATNSAIISGDVLAEGNGFVDINFGTNGSLAGKTVIVDGEGTIDLSFGTGSAWNLTGASTVSNVTFGAGSVLNIGAGSVYEAEFDADGKALTEGTYAITAVGTETSLTIANGAKLQIEGIKETTYNIAKDFAKYDVADILEIADNALMEANKKITDNYYQVEVVAKKAEQIAEDLGVSEVTGDFLSNLAVDAGKVEEGTVDENSAEGKLVGLAKAAAVSQNDKVIAKAAAQAAEAVQKMAEAGGNSATAAKVVTNVTGVTNQRLSLNNGNHNGNKGGHGVGLLEEGSGAAIWAQYVHGKDSVEDMPSEAGASSYEGQYNGIVMGVDFKKVGKFQSGIAFNYGEGDTNSVNTTSPTRSDYDFWGVGYYGNIRNADSNVIFDIGYAKTDSDVTSSVNVDTLKQTYEASPETTTWTAGVKVEKLYQNNNVQIVPYTGLRYMSIDPENYSTKCGAVKYQMERQDIWLLPVGVSIKQEIVNPNGWVVTPKVDLSYIWAFGDTDSTMESTTAFGSKNLPIGYDVMDDGSWMGLVGVEAAMDDWTFGVSYSYQKGDHSESKKWYVDAKYSF